MRKKLFTFLLALVTSVGMMWAQNPSGSCGENLSWEFNPSTGTLTITGSGAMPTIWDTPSSVSWHAYRADITSVSLPDGLTTIGGYAFYSCPGLTSVTIPENVTNIAIAAFANCANLASVTLPNSVLSIGQSALALCPSMTSLTLGSGLSSIGTAAFSGCSGLESVTNYATTPQVLDSYAFYNVEISNCELYVPEESVAAYQAATTWKDFKKVQAIGPAPGSASAVTAARFVYNYDCQRNPPYPKVNNACSLSGFRDPYEGYKGYRNGNIALGPWKLEFVANYTPSNNYDCASQVNAAVNQYYTGMSSQEKEAKKLEVPIFRLWQYNLAAREFQPAAYGIVCAYAGEANAQDHGALFVSSNGMGCFLSGHQHTSGFNLTCENDLTTGLAALVAAASAPSDPYYDVVWPVIVSIDAIGPVELSEHCKYYIEGSRAAYNALTDEQKAQVTNYSTLTNAETQWADLVAAAQPYADAVIGLINAIPDPVVYTQDCKDKIDAAQAAYDALTDGQKLLVTNADELPQAIIDYINAAHPTILFTANSNEKRIENVTLPRAFTAAEMTTILKELYGVEGDYDMYAYDNSNADAVNISYEEWTIYPFMEKVNVHGNMDKYDPQTGYEWIDFSLEISLELPPLAAASTDEQVPTNADPENPSYHYSTFFHSSQNYKLTNDGTQAFIADLSGSDLVLTEIANGTQVIPANTAVILRKTGSADPVVLTPTEENGVSVNPDDNSLKGVDVETAVTSIAGLTTTNCYVLSGTNENGVGFYRINSNNLKAHKAYVKYVSNPGQNNAPKKMRFVFNQEQVVTDIDNTNADIKVEKRIENGVLYIIKNGVRYNVQGQIVK